MTTGTREFHAPLLSVIGRTSLVFRLTACNVVHITMATYATSTKSTPAKLTPSEKSSTTKSTSSTASVYHLLIGDHDNQVSSLSRGSVDDKVFVVETPYILHCNQSRFFWLSWGAGTIQAGEGPVVGVSGFIHYRDLRPREVNFVTFDSGSADPVKWQFAKISGTHSGHTHGQHFANWSKISGLTYFLYHLKKKKIVIFFLYFYFFLLFIYFIFN